MPDTPIGTDSPDYTLVTADLGADIYCKVTATNASGTANADSNTVGPVTAAGGGGAFTYLVDTEAQGLDSIVTSAIDTTGADFLIVAVMAGNNDAVVVDSKSNTWNGLTNWGAAPYLRLFWSRPTTVGTGHTITVTSAAPPIYGAAAFAAFSGSMASPFDVQSGGGPISDFPYVGPTITPLHNNELVVTALGFVLEQGGAATIAGFTKIADMDKTVDSYGLALAWVAQGTAATLATDWVVATGGAVYAANASFRSV